MKKLSTLTLFAAAFCLFAASAYAGTVRGSTSTRHWCEVNGKNISVSPKEPPSQQWIDGCKAAGGKVIKKNMNKIDAVRSKTAIQRQYNNTNNKIKKNNRALKSLQRRLAAHQKAARKLKALIRKLKKGNNKAKRKLKGLKVLRRGR